MEMSAALCFDGEIAARLRQEGVPTLILGDVRLRRPDSVWRARQALAFALERHKFDVVVCHQSWPHAIFGSVAHAAGVPLVLWVHMAQTGHWLDRLARRVQPDLIVCNSRFTASTLAETSVRVEVVYYPLDGLSHAARAHAPDTTSAVRQELSTPDEDVVIVQVSRMEKLKGQRLCIAALAQLRDTRWTCWQVGGAQRAIEHQYLESLRADAERLGVSDRIRFVGQRTDISRLLQAADIFCQPNLEPDAFGISYVEALTAGLPVVTSAIGGAVEVVDHTCGVLVPPADPMALAAVLGRLIDDRTERERLGRSGWARARALCDPAVQMPRIAELIESVTCRSEAAH